jgi:type I restriction enzyme, S subunit
VVRNINDNVRDPLSSDLERYVGLEHLDPESLHIKRWGLIADGTTFTRQFVAGQVLFGKRRAYQRKVAVAEFDGICSGDILVFEPANDQLVPELLPFIVQSDGFFEHALGTSAGSLSPRTKWQDLARYEFALPPLDEQRRIAEILWAADNVMHQWEIVATCIDELRAALLQQLYSHGIGHSEFKDTQIGELPQNWKIVRFGSICLNGTQNGMYKPKSAYGSGVEMVHMGDIFSQDIITNGGKQRVEVSDDEISTFGLRQGDLMFARRSIVFEGAGKCSVVVALSEPLTFESSMIRVSLEQSLASPEFFAGWFQSPAGRVAIRSITRRGSIAGIAASDLPKMEVPLPSLEEQARIANLFRAVDERKQNCMDEITRTANLRRSLVKALLAH